MASSAASTGAGLLLRGGTRCCSRAHLQAQRVAHSGSLPAIQPVGPAGPGAGSQAGDTKQPMKARGSPPLRAASQQTPSAHRHCRWTAPSSPEIYNLKGLLLGGVLSGGQGSLGALLSCGQGCRGAAAVGSVGQGGEMPAPPAHQAARGASHAPLCVEAPAPSPLISGRRGAERRAEVCHGPPTGQHEGRSSPQRLAGVGIQRRSGHCHGGGTHQLRVHCLHSLARAKLARRKAKRRAFSRQR